MRKYYLLLSCLLVSIVFHAVSFRIINDLFSRPRVNIVDVEFKEFESPQSSSGIEESLGKINSILDSAKNTAPKNKDAATLLSSKFKSFADDGNGDSCDPSHQYVGVGASFVRTALRDSTEKSKDQIVDGTRYLFVDHLLESGPLYKAGVRHNDMVESKLLEITRKPEGSQITIKTIRNGKMKLITVKSIVVCFN
jgi:hypothetical protein